MMQMMERGGRHNNNNDGDDHHCHHYDYQTPPPYSDRAFLNRVSRSPISPRLNSFAADDGNGGGGGVGFIVHPVSKLDTLAGIAIKYGVEVSDIKRINGLVTDLQMFGLKSLQIPSPGRHPPSPCLLNGSETPGSSCLDHIPSRRHSDLFGSFQSLKKSSPHQVVSPAMSSLRGYYGLQPSSGKSEYEGGCEMAVYRVGSGHYLEDELAKASPASNRPLSRHRKCRSLANGFENGGLADDAPITESQDLESDKLNEKLFRRHLKSEADFSSRTTEMFLKEDNHSGGRFSAITGKGLALRPKAAARASLVGESETAGWLNPIGLADSFVADGFAGVRKSSSTSNLQDQDSSTNSLCMWPTSKWSLKPDLQALSTAAITRPIFDGLPKPITGRRNKAAID